MFIYTSNTVLSFVIRSRVKFGLVLTSEVEGNTVLQQGSPRALFQHRQEVVV